MSTDLVEPCVKSLKKLPDGSVDYNYAFVRLMCSTDGMALVRVTGEIDFNTAPKLSVAVDDALSDGACSIFIDLAEVTFFGSAGAMELLVARRHCQRRGAEFVLLRPSRPALRVLAFTDLVRPLIDLEGSPLARWRAAPLLSERHLVVLVSNTTSSDSVLLLVSRYDR